MNDPSVRFALHPDVLCLRRPDGSSRLIHLGGSSCVLDEFATRSFDALLGIEDFGEVDEAFVSTLLAERLIMSITKEGRSAPRRTVRARLSGTALSRLLDYADSRMSPEVRSRALLLIAKLAVRWLGWARTMAAWEQHYPQPRDARPASATMRTAIDDAVRDAAAAAFLRYECKERSLAALALCRLAHFSAILVLGVQFLPLFAHAWVECEGQIIGDDAERCWRFEPVAYYSGSGTALRP